MGAALDGAMTGQQASWLRQPGAPVPSGERARGAPRSTAAARLFELQRKAWALALRCCVLPVSCLLSRRERHLMWRLYEVCFGALRPGVYPEVALSTLVGRDSVVTLAELPAHDYNVTEHELLALAALTRRLRPRTAFEIGTADGRTTLNIAINQAPEGRVLTLNLPLDQDYTVHRQECGVGERFLGHPAQQRITQLWGDSRTFDFTPYWGTCELVFIDADHSAEAVRRDSETALRLVDRERGVVLWHDALRYGIAEVLPQIAQREGLPIYLVAATNLALLCFVGGTPQTPVEWAGALQPVGGEA